MGTIDWQKIYDATSTDNRPTPGYLFHEITHDISHALPSEIPPVVTYLADCVDGDHAHVKLKALFVIKHLAYRIPPFCRMMAERTDSVEVACHFTGPPSALYGDEPYRLVREAASGALQALTSGEFYHEQYRQMSQRIVGFGNYQPGAETVLADGSIDVYPELTVSTVAASTVDLLRTGFGAVFGSVKGAFNSEAWGRVGVAEGFPDDADCDPDEGVAENGDDEEEAFEDDDAELVRDGDYKPSAGEYVPPPLPPPSEDVPTASAADDAAADDATEEAKDLEELLQWSEEELRSKDKVASLLDYEPDAQNGPSLLEVLEAHARGQQDVSALDPLGDSSSRMPSE
mmetsp:Transcript_44911/g.106615  ORF Transcript_44911/g.106615 Transcript_44911/m.106615 type:complete len:344 (+) Transcript_44911:101-1132(+)